MPPPSDGSPARSRPSQTAKRTRQRLRKPPDVRLISHRGAASPSPQTDLKPKRRRLNSPSETLPPASGPSQFEGCHLSSEGPVDLGFRSLGPKAHRLLPGSTPPPVVVHSPPTERPPKSKPMPRGSYRP